MSKELEKRGETALSFGPFTITRVGLVVKRKPSESEWGELFSRLNGVEDAYRWAFGDALKAVEIEYGEAAMQMTAEYPEYDYDSLRDFRWVSEKVEFAVRTANLSWSHHRKVSKLEPAEQKKWLAKAEKNDWTVRELDWQLKAAAGQGARQSEPLYVDNEGTSFGFWAIARPLTGTWGSGDVWNRMVAEIGDTPDVAFGRTDNIPDGVTAIDRKTGYEWASMPKLKDDQFRFGYWDPPYDSLYKSEAQEIWRTCRKLAILHTHVYPRAWLEKAKRKGMYAVTMGPMKQMRCLQVFEK